MADKRISQLIERTDIANNDVLPIVASGATTTNKVTVSTLQDWMQDNLDVGVTSVGITLGTTGTNINVTGSPVTSSGNITINIPTASATNRGALSSTDWSTFNSKLSSVGLTMPSAFVVSNSPLTANGTIAVTGAGTVAQYIRGDGSLADFPEAGGGGASVSYYLNGSVSQGTIGGVAYYEMNKTPILGTGTDFVAIADGYLASFITDAGDPSLLEIPGGNWNFETYFSASSGGGSPSFYIELYKVSSGGTATLIASNSAVPELIAFGTTITPYFSTLAVPTTTLALTDRLALRYYVARSGRTITLHTENSHLCQIITTFTTGLTALNGLTAQVQNFATGTSGTDFNISSASSTHTFNLPDASASNRGVVTTGTQTFAGYKIFNGTIGANVDIQLATQGTALNTFIKNINATGQTSIGSNGFGFNNANNIYFSGSSKGGGIIAFSNTGNQTYTLQNASGTLAFTSDLGGYLPLTGGTLTGALGGTSLNFSGDIQTATRLISATGGQQILINANNGGSSNRIESVGTLPLALVSAAAITLAAGGTTPQITLATSGNLGVNNSSPAERLVVGGAIMSTGGITGHGANRTTISQEGSSGAFWQSYGANSSTVGTFVLRQASSDFSITRTPLSIDTTGAATFSSSVTANSLLVERSASRNMLGISSISLPTSGAEEGVAVIKTNSSLWQMSLVGYAADSKGLRIYNTGGTGYTSLEVAQAGGTAFIVNGSGSVGIGTASPTDGRLVVEGSDVNVTAKSTSNISVFKLMNTSGTSVMAQVANALVFEHLGTERMRITSGGAVGIGVTSPNTQLHVAGSTTINDVLYLQRSSSSLFLPVMNYWNGSGTPLGGTKGDLLAIGSAGGDGVVFVGGNVERMRITSAGSFLIGHTAATYSEKALIQYAGTGNQGFHINQTGSTAANDKILFSNGNGIVGYIRTDGSATSYVTASDYRLKEDLQEINGLEKVSSLKVYNFKWLNSEDRTDGLIAHELAEVLPYAVSGEKDGDMMQGVDYSKIVPVLIKAIQELKTEIDSLKNQIK
jgi:hypothetical protein